MELTTFGEVGHGRSRAAGPIVYAVTKPGYFDDGQDDIFVGVAASGLGALDLVNDDAHRGHTLAIARGANLVLDIEYNEVRLSRAQRDIGGVLRQWTVAT